MNKIYYQDDNKEFIELTTEAIEQAVTNSINKLGCFNSCPIPENKRDEIPHVLGMIEDIGEGDTGKGVERMRLNHLFTKRFRDNIGSVTICIISALALTVVTAVCLALWVGFKGLLNS